MKTGKIRGITDKDLGEALHNHTAYIRGLVNFANQVIRQRRLFAVWALLITLLAIYQELRFQGIDALLWFQEMSR